MSKLNSAIIRGQMKLRMAAQSAREKLTVKSKGEGNAVIITVVLLVIAIGLAITFRTEIKDWLTKLISAVTTKTSTFKPAGMA